MSNELDYDVTADLQLKARGVLLCEALRELLPDRGGDPWRTFGNAITVATNAVGFVPYGDGPNRLSDDEVRNAIPRVDGMLDLAKALLAFKKQSRK